MLSHTMELADHEWLSSPHNDEKFLATCVCPTPHVPAKTDTTDLYHAFTAFISQTSEFHCLFDWLRIFLSWYLKSDKSIVFLQKFGMSKFTGEASAALVFLILYVLVFAWMQYAYATNKIKWRSRYSLLFFHVTIRIASQACGLVFGILGFGNVNVFLAYLILGAEGYFTLVLCAYRFLISWHQHNLPFHESWLEPREDSNHGQSKSRKLLIFILLGPFAFIFYRHNPMVFFHCVLILANVAIIFGGSYLAGAFQLDPTSSAYQTRLNVAKITRTAGQSVFLACTIVLLVLILATMRNEQKRDSTKKIHPTLIILLIAWFPLIVRGIFGVLQAAVWQLSYYNTSNYTSSGFTARFTVIEYVLGVLTEWLACVLLCATYYTARNDLAKGSFSRPPEIERKDSDVEVSIQNQI